VKEGQESGPQLDIGLHYVATTGSSSAQPKDADSDGIPDFVENWHGDGDNPDPHGDETRWQEAETEPGIADALNVLYDDVDLDGDGMVGRIEKALFSANPQPLVPNNPLMLIQLPSAGASDNFTFEIPINYDTLNAQGHLNLQMDGQPIDFTPVFSGTDGKTHIQWKTTFSRPGPHFVQTKFYSAIADAALDHVTWAYGPLLYSPVTNILYFNRVFSEFSDHANLVANLTIPNADYLISLYDPSDGPSALPFKSFAGSTANGTVDELWDITDQNGNAYSGSSVRADFTITPPGEPSETYSVILPKINILAQDNNYFVVAYGWDEPSVQSQLDNTMQGTVDMLLNPYPYGLAGAYQSLLNRERPNGISGHMQSGSDEAALLSALANSKHFFFEGHGTVNSIQQRETAQSGDFVLGSGEVAAVLGNRVYQNGSEYTYKRAYPYRLVFLDACNTADEKLWTLSFGILPDIDFLDLGRDPSKVQAFVGWRGKPRAPVTASEWDDYGETLWLFFFMWMSEWSLADCVDKVKQRDPFGDGSFILNFPLGKRYTAADSGVLAGKRNKFKLVIYGYPWITRSSFQ
jgi:hypothetical protein